MDKAPVFVKMEEYKDIMDVVSLMREKINQAKFLLDKIAQLKAEEDGQLATWAKEVESVEASVATVDKALTEPNV